MNSKLKARPVATLRAAPVIAVIAALATLATPALAQKTERFATGVVLGSDWLQGNALPLNRSAVHSGTIDASLRRGSWSLDAGWLRVARDLSTVQGGFLSAGLLLHWQRVQLIPALAAFGGQGQESRDSTGYDFITPQGTTGHVPRYGYSSAASFGGGGSLTLEIPLYRIIGVRAVAQQWYFSGAPLDGDRARTTLGAGISLRVH